MLVLVDNKASENTFLTVLSDYWDTDSRGGYPVCSVVLRQELDVFIQMLPQPGHHLEDVDVEVSSVCGRPAGTPTGAQVVTGVRGAPAHYSHLRMSTGEEGEVVP